MEFGFNLRHQSADGADMSDVDAIRWMASEHDLEFVDLDTYGIDPAAGEILPEALARQHNVVAIKRKFGTPVVATSDPDDLTAQDTVRASIGRDFISVVAYPDQITSYLDQVFGPDEAEPSTTNGSIASESDAGLQADPVAQPADPGTLIDRDYEPGSGDFSAVFGDDSTTEVENADVSEPAVNGNGISTAAEQIERFDGSRWPDPHPDFQQVDSPEPLVDADDADLGPEAEQGFDVEGGHDTDPVVAPDAELQTDGVLTEFESAADQPSILEEDAGVNIPSLEPATSILPTFGSSSESTSSAPSNSLDATADELAALAQSVHGGTQPPDADHTEFAADMVAEAVATYQEQHGDEQFLDPPVNDAPSEIAHFPPLARALVEGSRVSLADMEVVLEEHQRTGQTVARILTAEKLVTEADLMWGMAEEMGLEFVDLDLVGVDLTEVGTIPESTARHHNVIVIANRDGTPVVAASNPTDVFAMDDLRTIMGRPFTVVVATRSQITSWIGKAFNSGGDAADMAIEASRGFDASSSESGVDDIQAVTEEAPIVRYVNLLILQALNERASDIHIEPSEGELRIRYRIDGVLHDVSKAPRTIAPAVTTRLKVMADMNIAEHRIPQDGRISLNVGSKGIDLRMATLPTIYGEKVVMRVLDKSSVVLGFADLGFDEKLLKTYEGIFTKPYGTILVTGPTGSGKSTTLYTTLTALNSPEKNIITVEDPVELPLKGVNQVQLNLKAGLNFASALRAILRSDPDIVLVGEIRDKETAVIAIEAALTGHMVLATLHTNNAASTPMRLIEMGLEPFLVTSSVSGVLAQRLARRLCIHCKQPYEPGEADIIAAGWTLEEVQQLGGLSQVYKAVGCSACANTGYRGRKALAELLPMSEEIERAIIEGGSVDEIHRIAVSQGMKTLRQSGLSKAIEGETTLEEVLRVVA